MFDPVCDFIISTNGWTILKHIKHFLFATIESVFFAMLKIAKFNSNNLISTLTRKN